MTPHDPATWWTAFGAVAQATSAIATFAAVVVSLWIALSERAIRASGSAAIMVSFAGDGTPGIYMVGIKVLNTGLRAFHVSSVGWRTGWLSRGPASLRHRFAIQNESMMVNPPQGATIVEPGRSEGFYTRIADMKGDAGSASRNELFQRRLPILGHRPIWAMINITGRKSLLVRVTGDLAEFLRTGEHASTTDDDAGG